MNLWVSELLILLIWNTVLCGLKNMFDSPSYCGFYCSAGNNNDTIRTVIAIMH